MLIKGILFPDMQIGIMRKGLWRKINLDALQLDATEVSSRKFVNSIMYGRAHDY